MYQIIKTCSSSKDFIWNDAEEKFFTALSEKLSPDENKRLILHRLSSGMIEPYYNSFPIGKVKLQGRKYSLQVIKSLYKVEHYEGTVDDLIEKQHMTVSYIRKYCK